MEQSQSSAMIARPRKKWLLNILLSMIIFISGTGVGIGTTFHIMTGTIKKIFHEPTTTIADRITKRMVKRMDLSEEQAVQVRRILIENLISLQTLRQSIRPQFQSQVKKTRDELAAVLTAEQNKKLEDRFSHFKKFWRLEEDSSFKNSL